MAIEVLDPPAGDAPPKKRGPGRPKGSKNKPKDPVEQAAKEAARAAAGNGDSAPSGSTRPRKKRIRKQDTEAIEGAIAEVLTAPAMIAAFQDDQWAVEHFVNNGKELAHRIAVVSERHSQLRKWCESLLEGESVMVVGLAAAAYMVPPLIHYNLLPGPDGLLGVPRRPRKSKKGQRMTGSPTDGTDWRQGGRTSQQEYEEERQAEEAVTEEIHVDDSDIEYEGEYEENVPPTFVEG